MREMVIECFKNLGLYIDEKNENILLSEYIEDSIMFISFIVEIEQTFDIEIPDEYLNMEILQTLDDVVNMIEKLKEEKQKNNKN